MDKSFDMIKKDPELIMLDAEDFTNYNAFQEIKAQQATEIASAITQFDKEFARRLKSLGLLSDKENIETY